MAAFAMIDQGDASLNLDHCIGCGLCVTTCPAKALSLVRKSQEHTPPVPANMREALTHRAQLRAQMEVTDNVERHKQFQ
ncbi:MAG: 4Fe-4S binding protein [Deltaproteobacteria bacterium]|nr:4Fe-4S binding protein [Deltaproteobacteria bacterium]